MNLINHVLNIRQLIHRAFDGQLERIGIENTGYVDRNLSSSDQELRMRIQGINDIHLKEKGGDFAAARDYTLNQCVFTLFNRLAAIKLMEQKELFPEVIKQRAENGGLSAAHQAWLENHPEGRNMERDGLTQFMADYFKEMAAMNFLLYKEDYPYSMMPTADELNEIIHAFNAIEQDEDCADTWKKDDILGWLYENFNSAEKVEFNNSGTKTEYDKVSLQSQVYTPSWVVKFLVDNSLGKLYLEMYPESQLDYPDANGDRKYTIANRPKERTREPKDMREIKVLDPACGSGNFLLYTFSLLYDMYIEQAERFGKDYNRREIPALIVENNLYGVDLDERAVQLAQIGLLIKARETGGRRARMPQHTGVVCSNFYLPTYDEVKSDFGYDVGYEKYDEIARKIWTDLAEAYKFGSLVRVEEQLNAIAPGDKDYTLFSADKINSLFDEQHKMKTQLRNLVLNYGNANSNPYTLLKMNEAMTFLDIISRKYDTVVANPPYTDSSDFGRELKGFVDNNYSYPVRFNQNLYSCFILRCKEFALPHGRIGIIHPYTFMFNKTYDSVRDYLINNVHIDLMVDFGLDRVNLFGPGILVKATFYVFTNQDDLSEEGVYFNLRDDIQEKYKKETLKQAYIDYCSDKLNPRVFYLNQKKFKLIDSYPFVYWISDSFRSQFQSNKLADIFDICNGISSGGNNERFYRYHWEVRKEDIYNGDNLSYRWVTINKGGPYKKWFGNLWLVFYWKNNGELLKALKKRFPSIRYGYENYYYKQGLAFSGVGKSLGVRYQPEFCIFERAGKSIFNKTGNDTNMYFYVLGCLNSCICSYMIESLNPTESFQSGDVARIPIVIKQDNNYHRIASLSKQNTQINQKLCAFHIIEPSFLESPITTSDLPKSSIRDYYIYANACVSQVLLNEAVINKVVFDIYELNDLDKQMVLDKEGVPVGALPVSIEAKVEFRQWLMEKSQFKPSNDVFDHLENLEERDDLPRISDFESLYMTNNDWEEFCIKHKMNPVEVWWQFKNAGVLPPQRTQVLAFELITDVIRALLAKDDDGVIPLTTNAGETSLPPRIEAEMVERGYNTAQIAQVFTLLGGKNLDQYLHEKFFQQLSDHLNLFMYLPKTPFIWHITSGPHHTLELFVSIYKWNRDTLLRIKSVYAANREAALRDRLQVLVNGDATQKMAAAEVRSQLNELAQFCGKIDELLASGYDPKLDDGVGKNIAPLQKAGLLSYNVLNAIQLKKYLNADW